jgi:hypothetical protein
MLANTKRVDAMVQVSTSGQMAQYTKASSKTE